MTVHQVMVKHELPSEEERKTVDEKQKFRQLMLKRIQEKIGWDNPDQQLKEVVLLDIALKIFSIHVRCLDIVERSFGDELWGYKVPPKVFQQCTETEQETLKRYADEWKACRSRLQTAGNNIVDYVVNKFAFLHISVLDQSIVGEVVSTQVDAAEVFRKNLKPSDFDDE